MPAPTPPMMQGYVPSELLPNLGQQAPVPQQLFNQPNLEQPGKAPSIHQRPLTGFSTISKTLLSFFVQVQPPPAPRIVNDEDEPQRDLLDWIYTGSRLCLILSVVYFYSNFTRFLLVLLFTGLVML